MRRALAAAIILSLSGAPLGAFLMLRRMSLMGDTMTHAILPGVAGAYMFFGISLWPMTVFGLLAGFLVAFTAGLITRLGALKEDASFTAMYLTALAAGVLMVSLKGSPVDLMHVLFGNVLAVDDNSLLLIAGASSGSILILVTLYRGMMIECFDPVFLQSVIKRSGIYYFVFLAMVVLNLVVAFQVLGTLMALGLMILPAIAAKFWTYHVDRMIALAIFYAVASSLIGLVVSYHANLPSGPAMVLTASGFFFFSLFFGTHKGILSHLLQQKKTTGVLIKMRFFSFMLVIGFLTTLFPSVATADEPIKVVASFSILGDMVEQVAGNKADVKTLVGANQDAHTYQPKPADIRAVADAKLVFVNGLDFEGWMKRLTDSANFKGTIVVCTKGVRALKAPAGENGKDDKGGEYDPHAWQSLANGMIYVSNISDALVKADPKNASNYKDNAILFTKEIDTLEKRVKMLMKTIPDYKRKVITSHDAFQYFGKTYGVQFLAPVGMNTESEPSAQEIASLIDQIREEKIHALFMENISSFGMLDQLKREGGGFIGGTLYSDALSEEDGPAGSYLSMIKYNVTQLIAGMQQNPDK